MHHRKPILTVPKNRKLFMIYDSAILPVKTLPSIKKLSTSTMQPTRVILIINMKSLCMMRRVSFFCVIVMNKKPIRHTPIPFTTIISGRFTIPQLYSLGYLFYYNKYGVFFKC